MLETKKTLVGTSKVLGEALRLCSTLLMFFYSIPIKNTILLILERELALSKYAVTFHCCYHNYSFGKAGAAR